MGTAFETVLAAVWSGVGDVVTTISGTPLLLLPVAVSFAVAVIGIAKGLMGTRRGRGRR